jgi:hypothetical protein
MGPKSHNLVERGAAAPAFIEQVAGRERGRMFELDGDRISIGRSDDNDIVIATEAVSRYHAVMERIVEGGWLVRDNQSKNGVLVNGNPVQEQRLQSGDVVQVGNFVFRYNDGSIIEESQGEPNELPPEPDMMGEYQAPKSKAKGGGSNRIRIYSIVGLLLAGLYYLSSGDTDKKTGTAKTETEAADGQQTARQAFKAQEAPDLGDKDLDKAEKIGSLKLGNKVDPNQVLLDDPVLKKAEQEMEKMDWTNSALREAESFFRRGQKEYQNKNYQRAIDDFNTALTIYRGHELADKYLRRALNESELVAKQHMEIGVKYFESLQYQRAIYHFNEVISLLAHRKDEVLVKEATKYVEQSKRRLQAAELFP